MARVGRALCVLAFAGVLAAPPAWSREVDLALVLAIDVSGSVNSERWELQRRGYEAAFKSPEVLQAITSEYEFLDEYYRDRVIGGAGAFMEVVKDYDSFAAAVQAKLVREIAANEAKAKETLAQHEPGLPAQAGRTPSSTR